MSIAIRENVPCDPVRRRRSWNIEGEWQLPNMQPLLHQHGLHVVAKEAQPLVGRLVVHELRRAAYDVLAERAEMLVGILVREHRPTLVEGLPRDLREGLRSISEETRRSQV